MLCLVIWGLVSLGVGELTYPWPVWVIGPWGLALVFRAATGWEARGCRGRARDLIDEYRQFVYPVVLGAGTPYFPPLAHSLDLRLTGFRTVSSRGVVYLRHLRTR